MTAQKRGSIINISSTYGHEGRRLCLCFMPRANTRSRASPSRRRSKWPRPAFALNAVAPGPTDTGMLDRFTRDAREQESAHRWCATRPKWLKPDDIANAVLFLAADCFVFVTGSDFHRRWWQDSRLILSPDPSHGSQYQDLERFVATHRYVRRNGWKPV